MIPYDCMYNGDPLKKSYIFSSGLSRAFLCYVFFYYYIFHIKRTNINETYIRLLLLLLLLVSSMLCVFFVFEEIKEMIPILQFHLSVCFHLFLSLSVYRSSILVFGIFGMKGMIVIVYFDCPSISFSFRRTFFLL